GARLAAEPLLGDEQLGPEPLRDHDVLLRLIRRERPLHLGKWLTLRAPCPARCVVRDPLADVVVLERLHVRALWGRLRDRERPTGHQRRPTGRALHRRRVLPDGPAQPAFDQFLEAGVAPGPLVVPPRGVEDAALALGADPGPRLLDAPLFAVLEDGPVLLVVFGVD